MTVRNRVVMSPMETMYGTPDGLPSQRTRDYFAARAKGGVGLITLGATGVDNHHPETPGGLHLATDDAVDAHRALVEVVHEHGAKIQPQIVHAGPDGLGPEMFGLPSVGPSVIPSYLTGRPSTEISKQQLCEVFDLFKAAVRRAAEAGYDGIELHAAHGYMLLGSFLAPQRNRRTDEYWGDRTRGRIRVAPRCTPAATAAALASSAKPPRRAHAPRALFEKTGENMTETVDTPALTASQSSWRCAQAHDREGWLALMADDVVIEDPIGKSVTNPDGDGVKGKEAVGAFFDNNIAANQLTITCEETFPSSSPDEIAHILVLHSKFEGGFTSEVRGVFTYNVNDAGLISNMRGYWNLDVMKFGKEE